MLIIMYSNVIKKLSSLGDKQSKEGETETDKQKEGEREFLFH